MDDAEAAALVSPEPAFAETVGRCQALATSLVRSLDAEPACRNGLPLRLAVELTPDGVVSVRRNADHFICRIGLLRLRRLAAMADHVSAAVILVALPASGRVVPAISVDPATDATSFPTDAQLTGWAQAASDVEDALPREAVRSYLIEAALCFLLQHELAHARLGHVDAMGDLLGGVILDEAKQAHCFSFSEAAQGVEYAADVAGLAQSIEETLDSDRFFDMPDALWASVPLRMSLRILAAHLVCIGWHLEGETDAAHPDAFARFLAMIALPVEAPLIFSRRLRPALDPAVRFALIILLQSARRLRFLQTARELHPEALYPQVNAQREAARKAMRAVVPVVNRHAFIPAGIDRKGNAPMRLELRGLNAETASMLRQVWQATHPEILLRDVEVTGDLGETRSSLILSSVLSLALGVPSGVAANWVWTQISETEQPSQIVVVIDGQTCVPTAPEDIERLIEAARQP